MKILTQFHHVIDCVERGGNPDELNLLLTELRTAINDSAQLVSTVLGEHREHHDFGPATCWSLACRLASKA